MSIEPEESKNQFSWLFIRILTSEAQKRLPCKPTSEPRGQDSFEKEVGYRREQLKLYLRTLVALVIVTCASCDREFGTAKLLRPVRPKPAIAVERAGPKSVGRARFPALNARAEKGSR